MKIKPWNFYAVRDKSCFVFISDWRKQRGAMSAGWEGWSIDGFGTSGPVRWEVHGNLLRNGRPSSLDLTEHLISCRDLLFRKLNPPPLEWFLAAYQRRLLEDFAA